jgi:hypothetical protein
LAFGATALAVAAGMYWLTDHKRPPEDLAAAQQPADAPALGSCWRIDEVGVRQPMPWQRDLAIPCAATHPVEVFHIDRVDPELVVAAARAKGAAAAEHRDQMNLSARRTCESLASRYIGGPWRTAKVQVYTTWLRPERTGYFACALAFTDDPAGRRFAGYRGNMLGALGGGRSVSLAAIECVADGRFVGCAAQHTWEFAGTYAVTPLGGAFDAAAVAKGCADVVAKYVGAARADLRARYVGPSLDTDWPGSDQTFACYVVVEDGLLRGSVRGIGSGPLPR